MVCFARGLKFYERVGVLPRMRFTFVKSVGSLFKDKTPSLDVRRYVQFSICFRRIKDIKMILAVSPFLELM